MFAPEGGSRVSSNSTFCCRRKSWSLVSIAPLSQGSPFRLGSFFVFASADAFQAGHYAWLRHIPGLKLPRTGSVLPLFGDTPLQLPGGRLDAQLARLELGSVTPDRDLYRQGKDAIRLLVVDPLKPHARVEVELLLHGSVCQTLALGLDANGAGLLELSDLTAGDYGARLKGNEQACSFAVAEYRLAPLVALLVEHRRQGAELAVTLRVETFGQPVDGEVRLDLMEGARRLESQPLTCAEGRLQALFTLQGEGPHSLNVQRAERTATVTLPGTRRAEREQTLFSTLSNETLGSLLPEDGTSEVRGVHLSQGAARNAPLKLEGSRLVATAPCECVRVLVLDPSRSGPGARPTPPSPDAAPGYWLGLRHFQEGEFELAAALFERALRESPDAWVAHYLSRALAGAGEVERAAENLELARNLGWWNEAEAPGRDLHRESMLPGDVLELALPAPLAVVAVGCYVAGRPWEGWAAVVAPVELECALEVASVSEPGAEVELKLDAPEGASVFMLVRDTRLSRADHPELALAGRIKSFVAGLPPQPVQARPEKPLVGARRGLVPRSEAPLLRSGGGHPAARAGMLRPALAARAFEPDGNASIFGFPSFGVEPPSDFEVPSFGAAPASDFGSPSFGVTPPADWEASSFGVAPASDFGAASFAPPCEAPLWDAAPAAPSFESLFPSRPPARATTIEAEVLLAELAHGPQRRSLRLPEAMGDFQVELFVLHGRHWRTLRQRLRVVTDLHVELDVPPCVFPGDRVTGRVLLVGEAAVRLTRDGEPVELGPDLTFAVEPGHYRVEAGERVAEAVVTPPGKLRRRVRTVRLMRAQETLERSDEVLGWTVLPGCQQPLETLAEATTNYAHSCCEQTSTKLVAAATMLALARSAGRVASAEAALRAGLERLESMWVDGRGFLIYPGQQYICEFWSRQAAVNLRALRALVDDPRAAALDDRVRRLYPEIAGEGLAGLYWSGDQRAEAEARAFLTREPSGNRVTWRHQAAFAVAILVQAGDLESALPTANAITADLNEEGRLYSTHDSVAALAMFRELARSGLLNGEARVEADERSLRVLEGLATVQVDRLLEEDWTALDCAVGLRVWWEPRPVRVGESVDLHVELEDGYQMGDLVYVNLPACLARVAGGGQVRQFAVDFEGRSQVTIPLVALSPGTQHFTLSVRNMYDEERAGSPGMLCVAVK